MTAKSCDKGQRQCIHSLAAPVVSMGAAVTLKAAATVSLVCTDRSPDPPAQTIGAAASQIVAVRTTQNG